MESLISSARRRIGGDDEWKCAEYWCNSCYRVRRAAVGVFPVGHPARDQCGLARILQQIEFPLWLRQ
jgi:hypothetical protein